MLAVKPRQSFYLRTYRRVPIQGTLEFVNEDLQGTGHVWNVSVSGCRVDGSRGLKQGTALSLALSFPDDERDLVVDTAVIVWARGHEYGLRFDEVDASVSKRLKQVVLDYIP